MVTKRKRKARRERLAAQRQGRYIQWAGADWDTGSEVTAGVSVNESTALNYAAVWCATRVICETIACLPAIIYERLPGGRGRERAEEHPLWKLVHVAPNTEQNAVTFHEYMSSFLVNWGTAYAEIDRTPGYDTLALLPLHAAYVTPYRRPDRSLYYEVKSPEDGSMREIDGADMFRVVGPLSDNGVTGRGVIRQARESIGMGLATEKYGAGFFGNGARPGGVLSHPGNPTKEAEDRMRDGWEKMHRGPANSNRTALLREGTTYTPIGIPPEDAQFLETRQHNVTEIARWYRLPPHKLGDLSRATFSNIEQQSIDFITDSILPWLRRWEAAYNTQLLPPDSPYYVEFLVDGMMRGDTLSRTQALAQQFLNGALTLSEWRSIENRNAVPGEGGDTHFVPLNLVPIDRALEPPEPPPPVVVQPPDEEEEPDEEKPPTPDEEQQQRAIRATSEAISAHIERSQAKEANAVRRLAAKPKAFVQSVERFYAKYQGTLALGIWPMVRAHLVACGADPSDDAVDRMTAKTVDRHCEETLESVLSAAECSAADLPEAIRKLTATWGPQKEVA